MKTIILLLTVLSFSLASGQVPAANRILGMQIDMAEDNDWDAAFNMALDAGVRCVHQFYEWSAMEPIPGHIGGEHFDMLDIVNIYYPPQNIQVEINIPVINTVAKEVPSDLKEIPFNDPVFIQRFKTYLDSVFYHIRDVDVYALNIGNESDCFWGSDAGTVAQFTEFFIAAKAHAKKRYQQYHGKDLLVGTTMTVPGLLEPATKDLNRSVNLHADVISVTYYGINEDFTVKPPVEVIADFGKLVSLYRDTGKPVIFAECGYPSSDVCKSSETMQADFIKNMFEAWDLYRDTIFYISIFKLTDWSREQVNSISGYYGLPGHQLFVEYLRTLGVRTWPESGRDKPAYTVLKQEAAVRGFGITAGVGSGGKNPYATRLLRNYPNPFNPSTTISYQLDRTGFVELYILNVNGRIVETLVCGIQPPGLYSVEWKTRHYSSGVYIYQLNVDGRTEFGKMMLTK